MKSPLTRLARDPRARAYGYLTITTFCWGWNTIFAKMVVGEASPMLIVLFRWTFTLALLYLLFADKITPHWPTLKPHLRTLALMGACGYTGFNALFYLAAHTTTALNIGIIQGIIPAMLLLGAFLLHRTRVAPRQIGGVALTFIGVCMVISGGSVARLADLAFYRGDFYLLGACLLFAGYTLALRRFTNIPALAIFAAVALAALFAALPLGIAEIGLGHAQWPTPRGWLLIALITLMPSFIAQLCFIKAVAEIGAGRASVFVNLVPVFSALLAVAVLGENFQWFHGVALALVVGGIVFAEHAGR